MGWHNDNKPYAPVAQRRAQAAEEVAKLKRKGETITPVVIKGRTIASIFWGKAWRENLEGYSDFENRLPRDRTYVRNGSVVNLAIEKRKVKALVSGSELYEIKIDIAPVSRARWLALKQQSAGRIGSLVELLQGKLSKPVMELMTDRDHGLFPAPREIEMRCSRPDYADMCKHLAAVLYGIGNRLDESPELLFLLRGVDQMELIEDAIPSTPRNDGQGAPTIASEELGDIFGIEVDGAPIANENAAPEKKPTAKTASKKASTAARSKKNATRTVSKKTSITKKSKKSRTGEKK